LLLEIESVARSEIIWIPSYNSLWRAKVPTAAKNGTTKRAIAIEMATLQNLSQASPVQTGEKWM